MSGKVDQYIKRYTGNTKAYYIQYGVKTTLGTTKGPFGKIMFLRNSNLTSVTSTDITNSTNISSGTTLLSGSIFVGRFTKLKASSKVSAMVYKWE